MGRSWKLGTAFGIGLYVHWSFLLAPALVLMSNWDRGLEAAALAVGVILAVFGCVVLHELGHALMARRFGIGTRDITLYPIGGVARLERMSDSPGEELAIAVAGPAVNVVIAVGLYAGMALAGIAPSLALMQYGSFGDLFLMDLFAANIALVIFNMIPAFPMDGGRVLRSLLALGMPRLRATELAVKVGMVFSVLFIFGGLFLLSSPMLSLVGLFVFLAGQQELAMVRYQAHARYRPQGQPGGERQEPVTVLPVDRLEPSAYPAQPNFSGFTWDRRAGVWIEWRDGRPVGACSVGRAGPAW